MLSVLRFPFCSMSSLSAVLSAALANHGLEAPPIADGSLQSLKDLGTEVPFSVH